MHACEGIVKHSARAPMRLMVPSTETFTKGNMLSKTHARAETDAVHSPALVEQNRSSHSGERFSLFMGDVEYNVSHRNRPRSQTLSLNS